jgi:hypothetical protein
MILVLLKSLFFALFRLEDLYLISTIHAIFMNFVKQLKDLHSYTSEKLARSILLLTKKMKNKLKMIEKWNQKHSASHMEDSNKSNGFTLSREGSMSMDSLHDFVREYPASSTPLSPTSTTSDSLPTSPEKQTNGSVNIQTLYSELSLYKVTLNNLLQFSTILLRYFCAVLFRFSLLTFQIEQDLSKM